MTDDLAGSLAFQLDRGGDHLRVNVSSTRPPAARILRGMAGSQAVTLIPNLFSLCGRAQGLAAKLAWEAACTGSEAPPRFDPAVAAEAAVEHLWRLLADWPQHFGLPAQLSLLAVWRRRLLAAPNTLDSADFRALLAGDFLGARDFDALLRRLPVFTAEPPPALLPSLGARQWLEAMPLPDEIFARQPDWRGAMAETGAIARLTAIGHPLPASPLAQRLAARRHELDLLARGDVSSGVGFASAICPAPGVGLATVETARGLLLHAVQADGERVADWVIVAPTEWNFRPNGPFCQLASHATLAGDDVDSVLPLLALALDPCVPHYFS